MNRQYTSMFFSIYMHIFLLFLFLTVFFWTVISKTESNTLYTEIANGVRATVKQHVSKDILSDDTVRVLETMYSKPNETVERSNAQLFKFNMVIIVLIFIGMVVAGGMRSNDINYVEVFAENFFIMILVGAIEYFFFENIAMKYVPVKPSYLPSLVHDRVQKYMP